MIFVFHQIQGSFAIELINGEHVVVLALAMSCYDYDLRARNSSTTRPILRYCIQIHLQLT